MLKFQFDALVKHFTLVRHKGQHRASGVSVCCGSREMAFRRHFVGPKSERLKLPKGNRREMAIEGSCLQVGSLKS